MQKVATVLRIPFSLSREHISDFKCCGTYTIEINSFYSTAELYKPMYFKLSVISYLSLKHLHSLWIWICLYVHLLGKEYMFEVEQKIRKSDRLFLRIATLSDIHPEPPKQERKSKQENKGLKKGKHLLNCIIPATSQIHSELPLLRPLCSYFPHKDNNFLWPALVIV